MEARHALGFTLKSIARMSARVDFLAYGVTHFDAAFISANVFEGLNLTGWEFSHHF